MIHGYSSLNSVTFFKSAIEMMPERGFTLATILYWISAFIVESVFCYMTFRRRDLINIFFSYYFVVCTVTSALCIAISDKIESKDRSNTKDIISFTPIPW